MKKGTRTLMIFGAGAALAYAISKEGSPLELPTGEGDGLVMQSQAKNAPVSMVKGQFNRILDDIATINGKRVILIDGLGEQDQRTGYISGNPTIGVVSPTATRAELNLVVSQVNNALRNTSMFTADQVVLLRGLKAKAQEGLSSASSVNGYFSLDGIF
tara:strand:- start:4785 stop:5258 length:474 start_codon:yes stop_codon:yes gene_type:complete